MQHVPVESKEDLDGKLQEPVLRQKRLPKYFFKIQTYKITFGNMLPPFLILSP